MIGNLVGNKYGLLVIGIVLLGFGIFLMGQTEVTCGDAPMSPGDKCTTISTGDPITRSYGEQRAVDLRVSWGFMGVGALMSVVAVIWIFRSLRRERDR